MTSPLLFDEPALASVLRRDVVPMLRTWPSVRIWQFGLSSPGDPWTTAIVLREEGLSGRARVYATDARPERVLACKSGRFRRDRVVASGASYTLSGGRASLEEYYRVDGGHATMREQLATRICFFEHDPRVDASLNEFQLVIWRPDGDAELSSRATRLIHSSLCRFGLVAVLGPDPAPPLWSSEYRVIGPGLLRREW